MTVLSSAPPVGQEEPAVAAEQPTRFRSPRWLVAGAVVGAAFVAVYVVIALLRLRYPYELEWIEGGMVDHVARARAGQPIYGSPSLAFTADIYTPLYFFVAAAVSFVTGLGFFPLRLVSFVASLALFGAIAKLAMRDSDHPLSGLVAAGLFAACYRIGGAWLDTARVDTMCLALLFWGLVVARSARTTRRGALAGLLFSLAFLTKQVAVFPAVAVGVFFLLARRGAAARAYAAVVALGIVGTTIPGNILTGGWYGFYVVTLPTEHDVAHGAYVDFFTVDLLKPLPLALVFAAIAFVALRRRRDAVLFHALTGGAIVVAAYSARLHTGGYDNVLLPVYAEIAVVAAIGATHLLCNRSHRWIVPVAGVALLVQFAMLRYDPSAQVPSSTDERVGAETIAALRALPSPAYLPGHPWYLAEVGQPTSAQGAAIEDVLRGDRDGSGPVLAHELWTAVAAQHYAAIVVDSGTGFSYLPDNLCRFYRPDRPLVASGEVLLPLTGTMTGPDWVWVPRTVPGEDCHAIGGWTVGPDG